MLYGFRRTEGRGAIDDHNLLICAHAALIARRRIVWSGAGPIRSPKRTSATKQRSRSGVPSFPPWSSRSNWNIATIYRAISRRWSPRRRRVSSILQASGSGALATRSIPAPMRSPLPSTRNVGWIERATPEISMSSNLGAWRNAIGRSPRAFSCRSNRAMASTHRRASSRAFGRVSISPAFFVKAFFTVSSRDVSRRVSQLYAFSARIASALAATIGGTENRES